MEGLFGRRKGRSPQPPYARDSSERLVPHYTLRRPPTPPPTPTPPQRVSSPLRSRNISAPSTNPGLTSTPIAPVYLAPPRTSKESISAPNTNPSLTSLTTKTTKLYSPMFRTERERQLDQVQQQDVPTRPLVSTFDADYNPRFHFPRPATDQAIEELFEDIPVRHAHSPGVFPGLSIDQKWYLVYNDQHIRWEAKKIREQLKREGARGYADCVEESPEWYVMKLLDTIVKPQEVEWLLVSLRCNDMKWFQQFVSIQGTCVLAIALVHISRKDILRVATDISVEYEIAKCLRHIFNSRSATSEALTHDLIVSQIASSLNTPYLPTRKLIMDILLLLVYWNEGGAYHLVLEALEALSTTNSRSNEGGGCYDYWFKSLEHSLTQGNGQSSPTVIDKRTNEDDKALVEYALISLLMINGILAQIHGLDLRRHHRAQMESAGIKRIVQALRSLRTATIDDQLVLLNKHWVQGDNDSSIALSSLDTSPAVSLQMPEQPKSPVPLLTQKPEIVPTSNGQGASRSEASSQQHDPSSTDDEVLYQHLLRELDKPRVYKTRRVKALSHQPATVKETMGQIKIISSDGESPAIQPKHIRSISATARHTAPLKDQKIETTITRLEAVSSDDESPVIPRVDAHSISATARHLAPLKGHKIEILVARLENLFSDRAHYKHLLSRRKLNAQRLLDMFQRLLDLMDAPPPRFRSDLIVATQRLAGKSGLYPMCFDLKDVTTAGDFCECSGAFADIYKGTFQDRPVCLKTIRLDRKTDMQHFLKVCSKEAILWGQLSHPNLLPFYGIYRFRNRLSLVSPWMEHGDINGYLRSHPSANRVLLASDVAQGLRFLHDNGVIHGDLKGPNILVDEQERACVADFGISSVSDPDILAWTSHSSVASKGGSVRWQAPELFDPEKDEDVHNTTTSDVYSWACVAYEIFAGQVPFSHVPRDTTVTFKVRNGERPARPSDSSLSWTTWGLTENIWTLMEDGWKTEPESRPTVEQIIQRLGSTPDTRTNQRNSALSPARFREIARMGFDLEEISVQNLETLLTAT